MEKTDDGGADWSDCKYCFVAYPIINPAINETIVEDAGRSLI